jgi:hypothetical protein
VTVLDKLDEFGLIALAWLGTAVASVTLALRNIDTLPILQDVFSTPITPLMDLLGAGGFELLTLLFLVSGVVSLLDDTGVVEI